MPSSSATTARIEVCPPTQASGAARRLWRWLSAGEPLLWAPDARLAAVQEDFERCLADLPREHGVDLLELVRHARTRRELWHLRAAVFHAIAMVHSQDEAQRRLSLLNRHFPTRSPRSGFGSLEP